MTEVSQISDAEWDVWRSFTAMRRQLDLALEHQLQKDAGISRPDFEILLAIFEAPEKQLRARELVDRLGWEKSRVSHQVTRMEKRDLVTRRECDSDLRSSWILLTPSGKRAVLGSMRDHATTIRKYFFDALTPAELELVSTASRRVLDAIDPPACTRLAEDDAADEAADADEPTAAKA